MTMDAHRRLLSVVALAMCGAASSGAQSAPADAAPAATKARAAIVDSIDALVPGWLTRFRAPSITIAHVQDGRIDWTRVYCEQSAPKKVPNCPTLTGYGLGGRSRVCG